MNERQDRPAEVELSVVIPVHNQEATLTRLFDRLYPVIDDLGIGCELVFVDAGSRDRSATLLRQQHKLRPDVTQVLLLRGGLGRHTAITAGFDICAGKRIVTLDADLEYPPEAIPGLLAELDAGHDYVGGSFPRRDGWRGLISGAMNRRRERITGIAMGDPSSTLCALEREVVDAVLSAGGSYGSIPALAYGYAADPTEFEVAGAGSETANKSKGSLYRSLCANLDLVMDAWQAPWRFFSLVGMGVSSASSAFVVLLALRHLVGAPQLGAMPILLSILFLLAGVILFGLGLLGKSMQRFRDFHGRPHYPVREHLRPGSKPPAG